MFLFLGLVGVKMGRKVTGVIGVLAMLVDTVLAYGVALTYFFGSGQGQMTADGVRQAVVVANPAWLSFTDTLVVRMGVLVDPIAAMMLVVITTVSLMVHLYSLGYMSDHEGNAEKGFQRYYAFLALFTFSMLGLVVATNIFQIFIFFEMVGLSSYLLIEPCQQEGLHRHPLGRPVLPVGYHDTEFLHRHVRLRPVGLRSYRGRCCLACGTSGRQQGGRHLYGLLGDCLGFDLHLYRRCR